MDIITSSLVHVLPVDVIYLDLQKAFDSAPHLWDTGKYVLKLNTIILDITGFLHGKLYLI